MSKVKMIHAKDKKRASLLPKLRFPEFMGDGEWEEKQLSKLAIPVSSKATDGDADAVLTLSAEYGVVAQGSYFSKKIAGDDVKRYIMIVNNDFVYNDRATKLYKYGTIKRLSQHNFGIVSPIYKCFRFSGEEIPIFWEWYFESGTHDAQLHSIINEGAKEGRFNISIQQFLSTLVYFPSKFEQQRIADCLSSLDERISTESQKLDTLKTHKKALMQQLFPAEGERVPSLRFAEFKEDGEWEEKALKFFCSMQAGKFVSASDIFCYSKDGLYSCFGGNGLRGYTETFTHSGIYPLVGRQGALCGNIKLATGQFHATEHAVVATPKSNTNVIYLFYLLIMLNLNRFATGQAQPGLSVEVLKKIVTATSQNPSEQQRIADCLSSLDELITAQAQKINLLKTHKKGLMQQLFPRIDEALA